MSKKIPGELKARFFVSNDRRSEMSKKGLRAAYQGRQSNCGGLIIGGAMCDSERERNAKIKHGEFILDMLSQKQETTKKKEMSLVGFLMFLAMLAIVVVMIMIGASGRAWGFETQASYYTCSSCIAESGQCTMANGKVLNDDALTVASWDYKFGQRLRITNKRNGRQVVATVTDRGPNRRLYKQGRRLDLSKATFLALEENLKVGCITVLAEVI